MPKTKTAPKERTYTIAEAAEITGVCRETVWRHVKRGTLPATRRGPRGPWRLTMPDLVAWNNQPNDDR